MTQLRYMRIRIDECSADFTVSRHFTAVPFAILNTISSRLLRTDFLVFGGSANTQISGRFIAFLKEGMIFQMPAIHTLRLAMNWLLTSSWLLLMPLPMLVFIYADAMISAFG